MNPDDRRELRAELRRLAMKWEFVGVDPDGLYRWELPDFLLKKEGAVASLQATMPLRAHQQLAWAAGWRQLGQQKRKRR